MRYRRRIVGKRTLRLRRRGTCCAFRIELERNDVSDVIFLYRRADLEADFSLGATQELALNQTAVLQLQCIGPRYRRRQSQRNKESVFQLEPHDVPSMPLLTSPIYINCWPVGDSPSSLNLIPPKRN